MSTSELKPEDILAEHRGSIKSYERADNLDGVEILRLARHVDDRGLFLEIYRARATHPGSAELARFFEGIEVAQVNYSIVDLTTTVKGLHYHLGQTDVWFCPPDSKMKIVLWDLRASSPTSGQTQTIIAGGGRDIWVKIPPGVAHGYRPLTDRCALVYIVTRPFDAQDPDERRIPWDHPAIRDLWDVENG
ncbi:MAG: hypothetical protein GXP48_09805 [Acidobacteria bacterium]|nr:hypothetical protein [Acidobacteriota bacterium]